MTKNKNLLHLVQAQNRYLYIVNAITKQLS